MYKNCYWDCCQGTVKVLVPQIKPYPTNWQYPLKLIYSEKTTNFCKSFPMSKLTKTPFLPNFQVPNGFFGITVNLITQKLKSKHFVCLSNLWWQVFLREQEKIFYTYSKPKSIKNSTYIRFWEQSSLLSS